MVTVFKQQVKAVFLLFKGDVMMDGSAFLLSLSSELVHFGEEIITTDQKFSAGGVSGPMRLWGKFVAQTQKRQIAFVLLVNKSLQ